MENQERFELESKLAYMYHLTNRIAEEFVIYNKYFNINEFSYAQIVKGSKDEIPLSDREKELIVKNSKFLLRYKYGIAVTSDNPIRIKTAPSK